jgi:hypothetical protein
VIVQEELALGQRVSNFTVESRATNSSAWQPYLGLGSTKGGAGNGYGTSVGNKRIMMLTPRKVVAMRLTALINEVFPPVIANFAGFAPCAVSD